MGQSSSQEDNGKKKRFSTHTRDSVPDRRCDCYIVNLVTGELRRGFKTRMRVAVFVVLGLWLSALAGAQEMPQQLGIGAYIGTPFGFTAKYLLDRRNALDFAIGAQGSNLDLHADALTHIRNFPWQPPAGKLAPYVGLGFKIENQSELLIGIRFVGGAAYIIKDTPLEAFAEIAPVLRMTPSWGSNLDGGVGLRYYFGGTKL
jgi:hypothetical protein